jgi:predicted Fe-S protein YdhL (DUF1289 family)
MTPISSPCVRLCAIDPRTGLCAGCGRTLTEIGQWIGYDEAKRRQIIATLPERLARIALAKASEVRP